MSALWYHEVKRLDRWWPRCSSEQPQTKAIDDRTHIVGASGTVGPEVRAITEVDPDLMQCNLSELQMHYSPDGLLNDPPPGLQKETVEVREIRRLREVIGQIVEMTCRCPRALSIAQSTLLDINRIAEDALEEKADG